MVYVREQFQTIKESSRKTLKIMVIRFIANLLLLNWSENHNNAHFENELEQALSNISKVDNRKRTRLPIEYVCCELLFYKPELNRGAGWVLLYFMERC